jgi:hypothetical protein
VADATLQILGLGTSAVPLDYNVSGPQTLDLIAVKGDFDGSAAGVDFVPVVEIISPAGAVMATSTGPTITAGSSATVTFAPFLRGATSTTPGASGWQFDTYPQAGTWGFVETTGTLDAATVAALAARYPGAPLSTFNGAETLFLVSGSAAFQVYAPDAGQINLATDGFGVINLRSFQIFLVGDQVQVSGDQGVNVQATGGSDLTLQADSGLGGSVVMPALPTSAPAGVGQLWNDLGTIKIT